MIHICSVCSLARDCGCGQCGGPIKEICTHCNNVIVLREAKKRGIQIEDLAMGPLGGYHIK